jgi:hypothetical protein
VQVLLAGFLRWVGLPPADLKLMTNGRCWVPGVTKLAQFARSRERKEKRRGNEAALGSR